MNTYYAKSTYRIDVNTLPIKRFDTPTIFYQYRLIEFNESRYELCNNNNNNNKNTSK